MSRHIFTLMIIFFINFISFAFSQNQLRLDPGQISFHAVHPPDSHYADSAVKVSIRSSTNWSLSCIAEVLAFDDNIFPSDKTVMKEGEEFYPLIIAIKIGSEGTPGRKFHDFTTQHSKVNILETDPVCAYDGSVKIFNTAETAIAGLPIPHIIGAHLNFDLVKLNDITMNNNLEWGDKIC